MNKGAFHFGSRKKTGVRRDDGHQVGVTTDVNSDGWLDVYIL